jgi:hypothetical protein
MNPQRTDRISTSQSASLAGPALAPVFFAEVELAEELMGKATSLSVGPALSQSPEIDPDEFESVYLWFIS